MATMADREPGRAPPKWGGIRDEAVEKATGCGWERWLKTLDRYGCAKLKHKEIAALIAERWPKVGGWWAQMVTVGYEQARGLRKANQAPLGFQVSCTKTVDVPVKTLFAAWHDARRRARWLEDPDFEVRKATAPKSMRITWVDGKTSVEANFYAKGTKRSYVSLQHGKLPAKRDVERMRAYWRTALEDLKSLLEA